MCVRPALHAVLDSGMKVEKESKRIRVYVRCRPLLETELKKGHRSNMLDCDTRKSSVSINHKSESGTTSRTYPFDRVFEGPDQNSVFDQGNFSELVSHVLNGYHATVFAYGQTGSGKTYTMEGYDYKAARTNTPRAQFDATQSEKLGVIPRLINNLFTQLEAKRKSMEGTSTVFKVSCSYVQIYNERIYDLMNPVTVTGPNAPGMGAGLKMRWTKLGGFHVENLHNCECESAEDLMANFQSGIRNKKMSAHNLNAASSRSHCMFTVNVTMTNTEQPENSVASKLCLVDLAGSERISATGTLEGPAVTFNESVSINKSLFTLRKVITALCDSQKGGKNKDAAHVPFRDSKLTSLLSHSLGGNSYTVMVACLSPSDEFIEENVSTLKYAGLAKSIVNAPKRNEDPRNKIIRQLREEVAFLRGQIEHLKQVYVLEGGSSGVVKPENADPNIPTNHNNPTTSKVINESNEGGRAIALSTPGQEKSPLKRKSGGTNDLDKIGEKLVDSVRMINDLVNANNSLRKRYDTLQGDREKLEKRNNVLMYENTELRQKVEMMESVLANEHRSVWTKDGSRLAPSESASDGTDARGPAPRGGTVAAQQSAMAGSYTVGARSLREVARYGANFRALGVRVPKRPKSQKKSARTPRDSREMERNFPTTPRESVEYHHNGLPNNTEVNIDIGGGLTLSVQPNDGGASPRTDKSKNHSVRVQANDALKWNSWTPSIQRVSTTGKVVRPPTAPSSVADTDVINLEEPATDMSDFDKLTTLLHARANLSRDHIRCASSAL